MAEYPFIALCICGHRHVPVPLESFPIDAMVMAETMLATTCPACGSGAKGMKLDQSPDAYAWYDATIRQAASAPPSPAGA